MKNLLLMILATHLYFATPIHCTITGSQWAKEDHAFAHKLRAIQAQNFRTRALLAQIRSQIKKMKRAALTAHKKLKKINDLR